MELIKYEIQKGDTLQSIAEKHKISVRDLISFHNENSPFTRTINGNYFPPHISVLLINPFFEKNNSSDLLLNNSYKMISSSEYYNFKKLMYTAKTESIFDIKSIILNVYNINQKSKKIECSSSHYDSYLILLSLLDRPFEALTVTVDNGGEILDITNQDEIKNEWEIVKEELNQMTLDKEMLKQIIDGSSDIYSNSLSHVKSNVLYNLFFPQLFEDKSNTENIKKNHKIKLYSSLFSGNKISLEISNRKIDLENNHINIQSKSFLEKKNEEVLKEIYSKTYKGLLGSDLEYNFSLRSNYSLDKKGNIEICSADFIENINDTIVSKSNYQLIKI